MRNEWTLTQSFRKIQSAGSYQCYEHPFVPPEPLLWLCWLLDDRMIEVCQCPFNRQTSIVWDQYNIRRIADQLTGNQRSELITKYLSEGDSKEPLSALIGLGRIFFHRVEQEEIRMPLFVHTRESLSALKLIEDQPYNFDIHGNFHIPEGQKLSESVDSLVGDIPITPLGKRVAKFLISRDKILRQLQK